MRKDNQLLRDSLHKPKLIRGLISFILGAGLIAYSFEVEGIEAALWGYPGIILLFVGIMLLLENNCDEHESVTSELLDEDETLQTVLKDALDENKTK